MIHRALTGLQARAADQGKVPPNKVALTNASAVLRHLDSAGVEVKVAADADGGVGIYIRGPRGRGRLALSNDGEGVTSVGDDPPRIREFDPEDRWQVRDAVHRVRCGVDDILSEAERELIQRHRTRKHATIANVLVAVAILTAAFAVRCSL